jgi:hypothetical protein
MRYAVLRPGLTTRHQRWHRADVTASRDRGARIGRIEGESFSRLPTADREERLSKLEKAK